MSNEKNIRLSKEYITQALFDLMDEMDYHDISISMLCEKALVGRATFYRHFTGKEDVVSKFLENENSAFRELQHAVSCLEDDVHGTLYKIFTLLKENKRYVKLIIQAKLEFLYLDFLNNAMTDYFRSYKLNNIKYSPYYFTGCFFNVSIQWIKNDCEESVEEMTDMFASHLFIMQK